jgi:hypothetical protein
VPPRDANLRGLDDRLEVIVDNATRDSVEGQCGETWLPVPGWDARYEVSNHGRVYSLRSRKMLKTFTEASGHQRLDLMRDRVRRPVRVHILVLEAFVGPRPQGMEACHGNGDPSDNRLSNLRWGSKSENTKDRVGHGTHQSTLKEACPRGHRLESPNLDPFTLRRGRRRCRACTLEQSAATAGGRQPDYTKADKRYALIMARP